MTRRTIFLDEGIWDRLLKIAQRDGTRVSELIRRAIVEWLRREEKRDGE